MHTNEPEGDVEVVLYERRELPPPAADRADSVYSRLEGLEERDGVREVSRETWAKRVPVDSCDGDLRDTYLSFTAWAENNGARLTPFFQTRKCFSAEEGRHTDWLVLPAFCLGIYADGVSAVYPHADESGTRTVEDGLQALLRTHADEPATEPLAAD